MTLKNHALRWSLYISLALTLVSATGSTAKIAPPPARISYNGYEHDIDLGDLMESTSVAGVMNIISWPPPASLNNKQNKVFEGTQALDPVTGGSLSASDSVVSTASGDDGGCSSAYESTFTGNNVDINCTNSSIKVTSTHNSLFTGEAFAQLEEWCCEGGAGLPKTAVIGGSNEATPRINIVFVVPSNIPEVLGQAKLSINASGQGTQAGRMDFFITRLEEDGWGSTGNRMYWSLVPVHDWVEIDSSEGSFTDIATENFTFGPGTYRLTCLTKFNASSPTEEANCAQSEASLEAQSKIISKLEITFH